MYKIALVAIALVTAGRAFAGSPEEAYRYSGQHAGGPADALISSTDGTPLPTRLSTSDPNYRFSGQHAGGPADALITNGQVLPARPPVYDPAYHYSGQHTGGPASDLNPE